MRLLDDSDRRTPTPPNFYWKRQELVEQLRPIYFESLGYRVAMHVYTPEQARGTVLVLHGYFDHAGLYGHLIRDLLQQGLAVVIYDLPGHGISSGDPVSIRKFEDYQQVLDSCVETCRNHLPRPWYAVGQSTGAAVLLDHLLSRRNPQELFRHWVLLAPLVQIG